VHAKRATSPASPFSKADQQNPMKIRALTCETRECIQDVSEVVSIRPEGLRNRLIYIPKGRPEGLVFANVGKPNLPGEPRV